MRVIKVLFVSLSFVFAATAFAQDCVTAVNSFVAPPDPVIAGEPFSLSVNATTSADASAAMYEWFIGPLNDTSGGVIGTGPTITLYETDTTAYWVRVTSSCGTSAAAAITVPLNKGACAGNADQLCV